MKLDYINSLIRFCYLSEGLPVVDHHFLHGKECLFTHSGRFCLNKEHKFGFSSVFVKNAA